jgi:hypothetical protein
MLQTQAQPGHSASRLLAAAAVLDATGALLRLAGRVLYSIAATTLVQRMDAVPSELVRRNWAAARAAARGRTGLARHADRPADRRNAGGSEASRV